jgi:DNA-binding Lrp family transcriptional regulator
MPTDSESDHLQLEIAHVLFIDIVGYSKLLITEQSELLRKLTEVVQGTEQFRIAETEGKLVRLPTGDGMALVFRNSPEAPVRCALELSKRLKSHPELPVRMGIHSGPVNEVTDVNGRTNVTGTGINMAQRVMDCGDAGHILISKHVADDLEGYPQWRPYLHELGEYGVKHGVRVSVVNLYTEELGNPDMPEKFRKAEVGIVSPDAPRRSLTAITEVFLDNHRPQVVDEFARAIQAAPEVLQGYYVTGDADMILIVTAKDMQDYEEFAHRFLSKRPHVRHFRTSVVMRRIKWEVALSEKTDQ